MGDLDAFRGLGGPAWEAAIDEGIDVSQIDYLLTLTPTERFYRHQQALALVRAVREAGIRLYGYDPADPQTADGQRS